ncbi:MAG: hypothetical protein ACTHMS_24320 [Jatrophihabitans sp.]|uniref:hypothetical protein n=1 Tax=Jatrophihabitans sp. TaxID=1932789 RepID=UPI003F7FB743
MAALAHVVVAAAPAGVSRRRLSRDLTPFDEVLDKASVAERDVDDFITSLAERTQGWQRLLSDVARHLTAPQRLIASIELCTSSPVSDNDLEAPVALRRMDAVLDVLDVETCSASIQSEFASTVAALSGAGSSTDQVRSAARKARPIAEMLTMVHPVAGYAASYGLGKLSGDEAQESESASETDAFETATLARVVMACRFAVDGTDRDARVRAIRDGILAELRSLDFGAAAMAADPRRNRLFTSALGMLSELVEGSISVNVDDMPALAGRNLAEAKRMLTALGLAFTITDDLAPNGVPRMIMADANWRVVGAEQADDKLRLLVRKNTDPR